MRQQDGRLLGDGSCSFASLEESAHGEPVSVVPLDLPEGRSCPSGQERPSGCSDRFRYRWHLSSLSNLSAGKPILLPCRALFLGTCWANPYRVREACSALRQHEPTENEALSHARYQRRCPLVWATVTTTDRQETATASLPPDRRLMTGRQGSASCSSSCSWAAVQPSSHARATRT